LGRQAFDHLKRILKGDDPLRFHRLALRHFPGALQGAPHVTFESVKENLSLHNLSSVLELPGKSALLLLRSL
jgi:hypothetical protein